MGDSKCDGPENTETCQENEIGGHLLENEYITIEDFRDNMIANVYNSSGNDYTNEDLMNQWEGDMAIYRQVKCSQQCGTDIDCNLFCRDTDQGDTEAVFYKDLHAFLIGMGKIEDDHNMNILASFRELLAENYTNI